MKKSQKKKGQKLNLNYGLISVMMMGFTVRPILIVSLERLSELLVAEQISSQNYDFIESGTICNNA